MNARRLYTSNDSFFANLDSLGAADAFVGRLRLRAGEEPLLTDLVQRGVTFFPSAVAQLLSRSKTLQARIYAPYMQPHTRAVHDIHDMQRALVHYGEAGIDSCVTKRDSGNAGLGILWWRNTEEVYTAASLGSLDFPFVLQPFVEEFRDIRVIVLGDYVEAYERINPANFRRNLHFGGSSTACQPDQEQLTFCRTVMERGGFPYAHIDLLITDGQLYLNEINLRGGLRGAALNGQEYQRRINDIHERWARQFEEGA